METKTSKAIHLFQAGDYKAAFRLFSGFKVGFSPDERRKMQITYECINDLRRCSFYESIGVDYRKECTDAWCIIMDKYILKRNEQEKLNHICKFCGRSAELVVLTDDDGYNIIKCSNCKEVVTEGFGDPDELLNDYVEYENYE